MAESGITTPSPIQEAAIPALLQGGNAAIQSYTGSGKVGCVFFVFVCVCVLGGGAAETPLVNHM